MIKTRSIRHSYNGEQQFAFPDFDCAPAETMLILGQSGVGKTTFLHILAGILEPSEGEVEIEGHSLYGMTQAKRDTFRGQNIGLVFQKPHFVSSVSARENLKLAGYMAGQKTEESQITALLSKLNITSRADAGIHELSQGELQRLSIARALVNEPKLILADEPTSALDDAHCHEVVDLLQTHARDVDAALIIVTHDNRLKDIFHNRIELY